MDEHSEDTIDLEDTSASSINMESDSRVSESLTDLEEDYEQLKKQVKGKMKQLGRRVVLCIKKQIEEDYESDFKELLIRCVGVNFDILDRQFTKFMFDVRVLFKDLVLQELAPFREGNADTENLMMDLIEFQAERDFKMVKGFEVLKRKVVYYVQNPKLFNDFLEIIEDILAGWDEFLQMIIDLKMKAKHEIKDKLIKREEMLKMFFQKDEKDLEAEKSENLEFTAADSSEGNGLNEFGEMVEENHDEQIEPEKEEESSSYSSFSAQSSQEGEGEGSQQSENDGSNSNSGSAQDLSSESSESSLAKSSETSSDTGAPKEEEDKEEGDKKEEPKARKLLDVDEDVNQNGQIQISKN